MGGAETAATGRTTARSASALGYFEKSTDLMKQTKWQLKLPGNGGGAATLFTYISCTFRHFPCEIGRCFFGINKHGTVTWLVLGKIKVERS